MRLFVAIELDAAVKQRLERIIASLKGTTNAAWSQPENLHITLKFLGEVREEYVNRIVSGIGRVVKAGHAFSLSVQGLGYFGTPRHMKVVWAGVNNGKERVKALMNGLNSELGWVREEHCSPDVHITLGRPHLGGDMLLKYIETMNNVKLCEQKVKVVALMRSITGPAGPQYTRVKVFRLV